MATLTYTAGLPSNSEQWFVLHIIFGCYHFASASRVAFSIFLLTQLWYQFISSYGVVLGSFLVTQVVRLVFLPLPGFHLHLYLRLLLRYLHHFHLDLPAERDLLQITLLQFPHSLQESSTFHLLLQFPHSPQESSTFQL